MNKWKISPTANVKSIDQEYASPLRILIISVAGIFIAEIIAMVIIRILRPGPYWLETLSDASIMVVIVFPVVYFSSFRTLLLQIAERKRSEVLLSKVLENLPVGVWITDRSGQVIHGNRASQQIWAGARYVGIEQYGEYKGWWVDSGKLIQPEEWAAARAVRRGETVLNEEIEIECFDGVHKIILNSAIPIHDEQKAIQGVIVVNQDITERNQYEQKLLQTNELLERYFNSIDILIAYMDRDFNFIRVNDAYARSAGHPADFFIGKNHFDLYPHEENQAIFQRVVDTGAPFVVFEKAFEYAEYPERGVTYWNWSLQPVKGVDGAVEGVVLSLIDVTERKRAELQLESQNQKLLALSFAEHNQRDLAESLAQATVALNESLDMETVLDRIFEQARRIIPFTGANVVMFIGDHLSIIRNWGFEEHPQALEAFKQPYSLQDFLILQEITRSGKPVLIEDTAQEPDWVIVPGLEWVRSNVIAPLILEGQVIGIVNMFGDKPRAFSQDIADRIMAFAVPAAVAIHNARLYETEQHARQVAEILSAASLALAQSLDIDVVLDRILEHTQHLITYDAAGVALLGDGKRLTVRSVRGNQDLPAPVRLLNHVFSSQEWPHIQAVLETGKALLIPDTLEYPGWKPFFGPQARNWLGIPIVFDENTIGILLMAKTQTHFFTDEHTQLAEALMSQASVAIQNAWLFEQVRAGHERLQSLSRRLVEVQESERRYIARELHDETSQALTALMYGLRLMETEVDNPAIMLAHLAELKQLTDRVLEDLHRLAMDLRPASLDHLGLVSALEQLIKTTCDRYSLCVRFKTVGLSIGDRLADDIETTLYRIVQEALTNAVRHAKASNVDVILELRDGEAIVVVEDDGVGFDMADIRRSGHLGMLGMQERAQMAGGSLQIESRPGGGTTIVAEVPYGNSHLNRR